MQLNVEYVHFPLVHFFFLCSNLFLQTRRIPIGDCKGNAFMSTTVVRGRAVGIVVRIGEDTEVLFKIRMMSSFY